MKGQSVIATQGRIVRAWRNAMLALGVGLTMGLAGVGSLFAQQALEPSPQQAQETAPEPAIALPMFQVPAPSPGTNQNLGGNNNEPTIAVDPHNPLHVATATYLRLRVATDGGTNFQAGVAAGVPPNYNNQVGGDSSLAYDSRGRLFWTYLLQFTNGSVDVFVAQCDPTTGAILSGYPVNISAQAGKGASANNGNDKEWLAADSSTNSPFRDRLYVVWSILTNNVWRVWTSSSADQGQTWGAAVLLSANGEGFVWPSQNTVAPNGDVYQAYHSQTGFAADGWNPDGISGKVFVLRSTDGGATYPQKTLAYQPGAADITYNVQGATGTVPGAIFWWEGSTQPWVLADPIQSGRIYVVASDDPDNVHGSNIEAAVYLVVSTDNGLNWTAPVRIDKGPDTSFQIMPTATIDTVSGCIAVQYYSNRQGATNSAGDYLLDVFATISTDGGVTFGPEVKINDAPFDPDTNAPCRYGPGGCGSPGPNATSRTLRIGEYNGIATAGGRVYAVWTGNDANHRQQTFFAEFDNCGCGDIVPPVVTSTVAQALLWPPNHNLVNVGLNATAVDNCDGVLPVTVEVFANEPDDSPTGDGNFSPDARDLASLTLRLRQERKGDGHGRVYLIISTATDKAGNVGSSCSTVVVPLSRSDADIAAVDAQALVAQIFCATHNGAAPPGFVPVGVGPIIGPKQ